MPDLIGVKDRRYLDATATHQKPERRRHRALRHSRQWRGRRIDWIAHLPVRSAAEDPRTAQRRRDVCDRQVHVYSLEPPANPNKPDAHSARGEQVFKRAGCSSCHTPPLYTNNKLVPVDGFSRLNHPQSPPAADVMTGVRVGLDPGLAFARARAPAFTRYRRCAACGIATRSSTRDRFNRSRSGSTRRDCPRTTARRDSIHLA